MFGYTILPQGDSELTEDCCEGQQCLSTLFAKSITCDLIKGISFLRSFILEILASCFKTILCDGEIGKI